MQNLKFKNSYQINKYPIIVTCCFFLIVSYVAFFHHNYWSFDFDGYFYLLAGQEILSGNEENVELIHAPLGGPILYATLNSFFNDGFFVMKAISVFSGTGIVFFSYYAIRNVFDTKTALLGQLFLAFFPWLGIYSIQARNDLLPVFLVITSMYFITKKTLKLHHAIITGSLVGAACLIRYESILVLGAFAIFLLIRDKKIHVNVLYASLLVMFFFIIFSPIIIYNYYIYGTFFDKVDPNNFIATGSHYKTSEWENSVNFQRGKGFLSGVFVDFDLFMKNYFYNLFYNFPNNLFGFENKVNSSLIPSILIIGIVPVLGGVISLLKIQLDKKNLIVLIGVFFSTLFSVLLFGDITIHFFALFIMPIIGLAVLNFKNIEKNFIPFLIVPVFFVFGMAIIPIRAPIHFSLIWISIAVLSAVFFVKLIPKIYRLMNNSNKIEDDINYRLKMVLILMVSLILLSNIAYSYVTLRVLSSGEPFISIENEFKKILEKEPLEKIGIEREKIVEILSKEPRIKESYVGTSVTVYGYYLDSKRVFFNFNEGPENDTIENYITRKNWKEHEIHYSNIHSWPLDRQNKYNPIPDYLIYVPHEQSLDYLKVLENPNNPEIPSNFQPIYKSKIGTIVYKISHNG